MHAAQIKAAEGARKGLVDETPGQLGASLKLPPWLESSRADIERRLPPVRLPRAKP